MLILSEKRDGLGIITFNNDERRNCLTHPLIEEVLEALDDFKKSKVWVVILRANPKAKVWSSGHDINDLPKKGRDPLPFFGPYEMLLHGIQDYPGPVIAMIEGSVWGGGCDLVMCCDIAIGAYNATFAMTPAKLGLPYNPSGLIHFFNIIGLRKVKEMFFTAEPISASDALHCGILNHMVQEYELEEFTVNFANKILKNSPLAVKSIKEQFRLLAKGNAIDAETAEYIQAIRRIVYDSEDYSEAIQAFKEKRKPVFKGI